MMPGAYGHYQKNYAIWNFRFKRGRLLFYFLHKSCLLNFNSQATNAESLYFPASFCPGVGFMVVAVASEQGKI